MDELNIKELEEKLKTDKDIYNKLNDFSFQESDYKTNYLILSMISEQIETQKKCNEIANNCSNPFPYHLLKIIGITKNRKLLIETVACKCSLRNEQKNKIAKNYQFYNFPNEMFFINYDDLFEKQKQFISEQRKTVVMNLAKFVKNILDNVQTNRGLYIHGDIGVGKTFLVISIFNKLAENNNKVGFVIWPEFIAKLKTLFNSTESFTISTYIDNLKNVPLLAIDDLGAEVVSAWSRDEILFNLLNYRLEAKLPIIITSNFNLEELEKKYIINKKNYNNELISAKRIIDRIKAMTSQYQIKGESLRRW